MLIVVNKNLIIEDNSRRLSLRFKLRDDLIYYINFNDGRERLYIPNSLEKEVFYLAYNL